MKFVAGNLKVSEDALACYKLVKHDAELSSMRFVNFKFDGAAAIKLTIQTVSIQTLCIHTFTKTYSQKITPRDTLIWT